MYLRVAVLEVLSPNERARVHGRLARLEVIARKISPNLAGCILPVGTALHYISICELLSYFRCNNL
jgi:hypothetical protein